jgi:hypothetical protein
MTAAAATPLSRNGDSKWGPAPSRRRWGEYPFASARWSTPCFLPVECARIRPGGDRCPEGRGSGRSWFMRSSIAGCRRLRVVVSGGSIRGHLHGGGESCGTRPCLDEAVCGPNAPSTNSASNPASAPAAAHENRELRAHNRTRPVILSFHLTSSVVHILRQCQYSGIINQHRRIRQRRTGHRRQRIRTRRQKAGNQCPDTQRYQPNGYTGHGGNVSGEGSSPRARLILTSMVRKL